MPSGYWLDHPDERPVRAPAIPDIWTPRMRRVAVRVDRIKRPRKHAFFARTPVSHGAAGRTAVLLVNLGTPAAPAPGPVRAYLREFLSDPRVVEIPRLLWWPILHGVILRLRPRQVGGQVRERSGPRTVRRCWCTRGSRPCCCGATSATAASMPTSCWRCAMANHRSRAALQALAQNRTERAADRADVSAVLGDDDRFGARCSLRRAEADAQRAGSALGQAFP